VSPHVKTRHRLRNWCHDSSLTQQHRCQPQPHNTSPPPRQNTSLTTFTCAIHSPPQHRLPCNRCPHRLSCNWCPHRLPCNRCPHRCIHKLQLRGHPSPPSQPLHYHHSLHLQHHSLHHPARSVTALPQLQCMWAKWKNEGKMGNKSSLLSNLLITGWMKKPTHPSNPLSVIVLNPYNGTQYHSWIRAP